MIIPNKLLITTFHVKLTILNEIFEKHPDLFDNDETEDADFNMLALFIFYEKLKNEKSFYFPMFEVTEQSFTMLDWTENEMQMLDDPCLISEVRY